MIDGEYAQRTLAMLQASPTRPIKIRPPKIRPKNHSTIRAEILNRDAALKGFHFGKFDLAIEAKPDGSTLITTIQRALRACSHALKSMLRLQSAAGRKDALTTTSQISSEPGSRYIDFLIPGLLGMNLMNSGMWGVGFALVEMRQRKLLKRFVATPMRRSDFLLGTDQQSPGADGDRSRTCS